MSNNKNPFIPITVEDWYPKVAVRLLNRILKINPKKVALFGFSTNMKWLLRLLQENSVTPTITDWREKYLNYDCGGYQMVPVTELDDDVNKINDNIIFPPSSTPQLFF